MSLEEQERFIAFTVSDLREVIRSGEVQRLINQLNDKDIHALDDAIAEVWNNRYIAHEG